MLNSKKIKENFNLLESSGSYDPKLERDACGVGLVAKITGEPSHEIVEKSLKALCNLEHRGASGADSETGDGAGILIQIPHDYFRDQLRNSNIELNKDNYGTGLIFCGKTENERKKIQEIFENCSRELNLEVLSWWDVPTAPDKIGKTARDIMPLIKQVFVGNRNNKPIDNIEQKLFILRKKFENIVLTEFKDDLKDLIYVCSLSSTKIVYKWLLTSEQFREFYIDLQNPDVKSSFGLVHSRFSTNTLGDWKLAHPYRFVAHNGEINTVRGNRNWMSSREPILGSEKFGDYAKD